MYGTQISLEHLELHFNKQDALFKKIMFGLFQTATSDEFKCEETNKVSKLPELIFQTFDQAERVGSQ